MNLLALALRNLGIRNACARVAKESPYKRTVAEFLSAKSQRNGSLEDAAGIFLDGYERTVAEGNFVNELEIQGRSGEHVLFEDRNGRSYTAVNLSNNSYNDLDREPECRARLADYVASGELSSCLSRKIAGELPVHKELEREIADFLGLEKCVLATSGYVAQLAAMYGLFGKGDVIFSDRHNHSSLVDGMRLSGAKVIVYPHLDYVELARLLRKHRGSYNCAGIVSDGVFSAHGTIADLDHITSLAREFRAVSVIDDTHGFAAVGGKGRGILDFFESEPDILTASLAKGLAGFGGMVAGKASLVKVIDMLGRQNVNTSHLSPLVAAQGLIQLRFLRENLSEIRGELHGKLEAFNDALREHGIESYGPGPWLHPIFSFYLPEEADAVAAVREVFAAGVLGAFFPPPVSPHPTLRLSLHRNVPIEILAPLAATLARLGFKPISEEFRGKLRAGFTGKVLALPRLEVAREAL